MKAFHSSNEESARNITARFSCDGFYNLALPTGSGERPMQNKSRIMQHENRQSCYWGGGEAKSYIKITDQQSSEDWQTKDINMTISPGSAITAGCQKPWPDAREICASFPYFYTLSLSICQRPLWATRYHLRWISGLTHCGSSWAGRTAERPYKATADLGLQLIDIMRIHEVLNSCVFILAVTCPAQHPPNCTRTHT